MGFPLFCGSVAFKNRPIFGRSRVKLHETPHFPNNQSMPGKSSIWNVRQSFNVMKCEKFIDISNSTLQLTLRNYHLLSFGEVSKKTIHDYLRRLSTYILVPFPRSSYSSTKTTSRSRLNAEPDMRIQLLAGQSVIDKVAGQLSSFKPDIENIYKNNITLPINFFIVKNSFFMKFYINI